MQNYSGKPGVPKHINSIIDLNRLYLIIILKLIIANVSLIRFHQYSIFDPLLRVLYLRYIML